MYGEADRLRLLVVQRPEDRIRAPIVRRQPRVHVEDRSAGQTDDGRLDHCGPVDGDDVRREVLQERTALVAVGGGNTTHEITAVPLEPAPATGFPRRDWRYQVRHKYDSTLLLTTTANWAFVAP